MSFNECWIGIAVRVRSTKVLRDHSGWITKFVASMNYDTTQKGQ